MDPHSTIMRTACRDMHVPLHSLGPCEPALAPRQRSGPGRLAPYIYTHIHIHTHTYTHTYIHTHTHIHIPLRPTPCRRIG